MATTNTNRWIFVSHASEDIVMVRKVRNYLERNGGSPLLFHLVALEETEKFWPLIEQEIEARNFFLYCRSPASEASTWVRRERSVAAASVTPKRLGEVDVTGAKLNKAALNKFLADRSVFLSYSRKDADQVQLYSKALKSAGFTEVSLGYDNDPDEPRLRTRVERAISRVVQGGWLVHFISRNAMLSSWVEAELTIARTLGATIIFVALDPDLDDFHVYTGSVLESPSDLIKYLLKTER
jgi:hypothetical protein